MTKVTIFSKKLLELCLATPSKINIKNLYIPMLFIQILGIEEYHKTVSMKTNVVTALKELNLPARIESIGDIDQLMTYGIIGIPALAVNGRVFYQKRVPQVEEIKSLFKTAFLPEQNKIDMKKILVPTDFSEAAHNAYLYARELAFLWNAELEVVNCYIPPINMTPPVTAAYFKEVLKVIQERLDKSVKNHPPNLEGDVLTTTVKVDTAVVPGMPTVELVERSKREDIDLIVMATTGEHNVLEKMFGSVSSEISKKAHCPVLLIPKGVVFQPFRQLLIATDKYVLDKNVLDYIQYFASNFYAAIHFVHVSKATKKADAMELKKQLVEQLFGEKEPNVAIHISTLQHQSVWEGLDEYARNNHIDLMVVVTRHRGFWKDLLHKSMTKHIAFQTKLPLLVTHIVEQG